MCSITPETAKVASSSSHMQGPGIGCWFSDSSNCSHWSFEARITLTFTLTSENQSLYITLLLLLVVIQLCSPRRWHLDSNYCRTRCRQSQPRFVLSPLLLLLRLLGTFHFSRWLDVASMGTSLTHTIRITRNPHRTTSYVLSKTFIFANQTVLSVISLKTNQTYTPHCHWYSS